MFAGLEIWFVSLPKMIQPLATDSQLPKPHKYDIIFRMIVLLPRNYYNQSHLCWLLHMHILDGLIGGISVPLKDFFKKKREFSLTIFKIINMIA